MDHLWSPWRFRYICQGETPGRCAFCELASGDPARDRENYVLHRGRLNFVVLNLFPYITAHTLIVPFAHVARLPEVGPESMTEMMALAQKLYAAIESTYHPDGYNLGMNFGKAAGAGISDHLHLHVLPRWTGSANFLTVVGETRVMPEDLATTYDKLVPFFQ
jgi:ATP adenylyltransferase